MASFFDEIARNNLRSIILMVIFTLFFAGIIFVFVTAFQSGVFGFALGLLIILGFACYTYFLGDQLILKVSRAQPADRKQYSMLYDVVEGLAAATQIPAPKVYIINDPNPNAFATGKNRKVASIAVTTGLLSIMNRNELQGVISHEISHIADNDMLFMMLAVVYAGSIGLFAAFARNMLFWGGFRNERGEAGLIILVIALVLSILAPIFALLVRLAISRRREYMADANGARITRDPASLASALKKIEKYELGPTAQPVMHANEITASLYFANPFTSRSVMNLFSTHPPIEDRINRLQHMY